MCSNAFNLPILGLVCSTYSLELTLGVRMQEMSHRRCHGSRGVSISINIASEVNIGVQDISDPIICGLKCQDKLGVACSTNYTFNHCPYFFKGAQAGGGTMVIFIFKSEKSTLLTKSGKLLSLLMLPYILVVCKLK